MLLDNFFKILSLETEGNSARATIELNPHHAIYSGHFPEMPITPGVCMIQIFTETLEKIVGSSVKFIKGDQIKFLTFIEPLKKNDFILEIKYVKKENDQLYVTGDLFSNEITYFKFKGYYTIT